MNSNEITINGTPLSSLGATLISGGYAALMMPAPLKEFVENDDPLKPGTQVITKDSAGNPIAVVRERDVTLAFLIEGSSQSDFLAKYASFVNILHRGAVTLHVPDLDRYFHLIYSNSTQYDNFLVKACRLAVKFREPNPANRGQ